VLVKGGGFIHAYGGPRWLYYLLYQLFPAILALRLEKPVGVLPNSFGPFCGRAAQRLVRWVLRRCAIVTAREHISARTAEELIGRSVPVYPDLAFALRPAPADWARAELRAHGVQCEADSCIGFTVRPWRFPGRRHDAERLFRRYLDSVEHLVCVVREMGFSPVLFAHCLGNSRHEDDRVAIAILSSRLHQNGIRAPSLASDAWTAEQLAALYGEMHVLVATRFHSAIFAAVSGVPSLVIAYGGNKGLGIMQDMGLPEYVVPIEEISPVSAEATLRLLLANRESARARLKSYVDRFPGQADALVTEVRRSFAYLGDTVVSNGRGDALTR